MTATDLIGQQHKRNPVTQPAIALASLMASRIAGHWRAMRNRRSIGQFLDWDARMLQDVGLTRGDLFEAMAGRMTDNPATRQMRVPPSAAARFRGR